MNTVASIMPFPFHDKKPGLAPGSFRLAAGDVDHPALLVIREATIQMMNQDLKPITMKVDLDVVAKDVCLSYNSSQIGYGPEAKPGLFWVHGEYLTAEAFINEHKFDLKVAEKQQRSWFLALVKIADDDWAKSPQHRMVSDLQRMAARHLNLDRPWVDSAVDSNKRCPACATIISGIAAVCFACSCIVDIQKYEKMQFAGKRIENPQPQPQPGAGAK